jgi:hypothetical protein
VCTQTGAVALINGLGESVENRAARFGGVLAGRGAEVIFIKMEKSDGFNQTRLQSTALIFDGEHWKFLGPAVRGSEKWVLANQLYPNPDEVTHFNCFYYFRH